jgi:hypothetical protein
MLESWLDPTQGSITVISPTQPDGLLSPEAVSKTGKSPINNFSKDIKCLVIYKMLS